MNNIKLGQIWPAGQWVYVKSWSKCRKQWYLTDGMPTNNEDGLALRREEDELSEDEANALGLYRNVLLFNKKQR